jgi:aldose 1-epimerase
LPRLGGGVTTWQTTSGATPIDLWQPWDGLQEDAFKLASFRSPRGVTRIGAGGFEHDGRFHSIAPSRQDQRYPIHGDAWQQRGASRTAARRQRRSS